VYAQRQSSFVLPQETDARIDTDLEAHYVAYNPSVASRNQLFLFFQALAPSRASIRRLATSLLTLDIM
jgi:hypothetical protein